MSGFHCRYIVSVCLALGNPTRYYQLEEALAGIPSLGGGLVLREQFYNMTSGLEGIRYNITLGYATGDLAMLSVVTSDLAGVGVKTSASEV